MTEGPDAQEFEALRPLLFTVAYEMLEVAADAEDVVQEAWLRWSRVDPTTVSCASSSGCRSTVSVR
jgi:RNA polymerase sigma-70 factor, ECF subfamily